LGTGMITLIEAKNFRALRYIRQELKRFQVLTGPNAAGKTTFMDVLSFLSDLIAFGPAPAIQNRAQTFDDLLSEHRGDAFELAVEARVPDDLRKKTSQPHFDIIRYEVRIGRAENGGPIGIISAIDASDILCFQKGDSGATDIVPGSAHPALRDWKGETNLGVLFASGILG
jgi:predicted ATP-dependent endonuclease of OLD family